MSDERFTELDGGVEVEDKLPELPIPIPLTSPIKNFADTLTELVLEREPCGRDLLAMDRADGEGGKTLALIGSLFGLSKEATQSLTLRDIARIERVLGPFSPGE